MINAVPRMTNELISKITSLQIRVGKYEEISPTKQKISREKQYGYLYQPNGAGGTRSPPATLHRLQHLTARLIQNGRRGLERG